MIPLIAFVIGIGVMALIMLITSMIIDAENHMFLKLINILFSMALILMIPLVISESRSTCQIVLTNQTQIGNSTAFTYGEQCFASSQNSPDTLITVSNAYLWTAGLYWFIVLLIFMVEVLINQLNKRGYNINPKVLRWIRGEL